MTLQALARQAAEVGSDLHRDLSARTPLNAVIECAHRAGVIGEARYHALLGIDAEADFSRFVAPGDPLVMHTVIASPGERSPITPFREHRVSARKVPAGALLAFIRVERPTDRSRLGHRHLVHAMVSLGGGEAAGCDVARIGVSTHSDGWSIVDLERDLVWIERVPTNRYDVISRYPLVVRKVERLRLRYRLPSFGAVGPIAEGTAWGHPEPSPSLHRHVVTAAAKVLDVGIEPGNGNVGKPASEHVFRVWLRFEIGREEFEEFFNSPNELRGHYYADANRGDAYTRTLLEAIAEAVDWQEKLVHHGRSMYFGLPFDPDDPRSNRRIFRRLKASLGAGKIWYREKKSKDRHASCVQPDRDWPNKWTSGSERYRFAPNTRWVGTRGAAATSWRAFLEDTRANEHPDVEELERKLGVTGTGFGIGLQGSNYYRCMTAAERAKHGASPDNLVAMGDWVNPRGKPAGFHPPEKLFRGHQIKWFGFT